MSEVSSTKKLVSAGAVMASGTMISRVLGVIRVMLIAFILGNGTRQADMLGLATMVPNSLYILFAGGALNTVLVPQIVRHIKKDPDGGEAYTNRIMTAFMLIIAVVAVVVTAAAPIVTQIYTSADWRSVELSSQYSSMVMLTYLTLPQIFFYGAFFLLGQILNARDKFGPMMWAPIANNVVSIIVLSTYLFVWGNDQNHSAAFTTPQLLVLGIGSTVGIVVQMLVLLPFVKQVGFRLRPRFDLRGTGLGKTFSLTKWTIGFVAVNQLALMVVNRLATSATAGGSGAGVAVYANAHLIWILPHSLITVSLATAMLPNASRLAASGDSAGVAQEYTKTVRLALIAIVPAAVALLALAGPISGALFGFGTGAADADWIGRALVAFSVGLIPFTIQFMCLRTFYALEDTRTPFLLQLLIAGVNMLGAVAFVWLVDDPTWVAAALASAYSLAYLSGVMLSWNRLKVRVPDLNGGALLMHILRLGLASGVGGALAYFASQRLRDAIDNTLLGNAVAIVVGGLLILGSYVLIGKALKVRELTSLGSLVRGRFGRRPADGDAARKQALNVAEGSSREQLLVDDQPTFVQPAVRDDEWGDDGWDDEESGPATIVRNRPPVATHTFDAPPTAVAEVDDVAIEEPTEDGYEPHSEDTGGLDMFAEFEANPVEQIASPGTLLHTRYELLDLLAQRHRTETWRAHDQVLSRDVVVHVVAPGDERIAELLLAARKGAAATDSRFLRVLDADEVVDPEQGIGAYVVAEYSPGNALTDLLQKGRLSAIEAAFIVRELADALVGVHAQGLFHEQLHPDNVIITTSGSVRLVGFGTEATLAGGHEDATAWRTREQADVVGLGKLLYASLVRHWPGEAAWGMPAAPVVDGEIAPPQVVEPGVSPALDRICSVILSSGTDPFERRISTASQLVDALTTVLGSAEASLDLEQRVRSWEQDDDEPVTAVHGARPYDFGRDSEAGEPSTVVLPREDEDSMRLRHGAGWYADEGATSPETDEDNRRPLPPLKWLLLLAAVLLVIVALVVSALMGGGEDEAAQPSTSPVPAVSTSAGSESTSPTPSETGPIVIVDATDFDPETDGGNNEELPERVAAVYDGDPSTTWVTMRYLNRPDLGGLKPGVGVVVDLGEVRTVTAADLVLAGGETAVELRVPTGPEPSTRTEADWEIVAADDAASGTATLTLAAPVETRYLLVYFTLLPAVEGGFRAELGEVTVR